MSVQEITREELAEPRVRNDWKALLGRVSYRAIVNNVPYMAFVALLCVLYINNTNNAVETQRELNRKNLELKELRWKYMDINSQLMNVRVETEVIKNASNMGLKPLMLPAYTIATDTTKASAKP